MAASLGSLGPIEAHVRLVRKERRLPLPGEVLVAVGDEVKPDTPIAKIALRPGVPWVIPAARRLGIEPRELSRHMVKKVGDSVKTQEVVALFEDGRSGRRELVSPTDGVIESVSDSSGRVIIREEYGKEDPPVTFDVAGEIRVRPEELMHHMIRGIGQEVKKTQIIAKKGDMQAFFTKTALAPISGVISAIDTKTGKVTISRPFKQVVVNAYLSGKVTSIIPERGCVIETPGVRLTGIFGIGRETFGKIRVLTERPDQSLEPEMVTPDCEGCIIVGGALATEESLRRALEVGVKGVITGTVNYYALIRSLGVKLGVGITGQEDIDLTLLLTEGFGRLAMRREVYETLKALEGHVASMSGATQIRAGALRPEVIVPFQGYAGEIREEQAVDEDIKLGAMVRIVSEPFFGEVGRIVDIVREPRAIGTEAKVPVVSVELDGARRVTVPRANVEVY